MIKPALVSLGLRFEEKGIADKVSYLGADAGAGEK